MSSKSSRALDDDLAKLQRRLGRCRDASILPGIHQDISLKQQMITERDGVLLCVLQGEQHWNIEGDGLCWHKATSHGLSVVSNYETHFPFEQVIADIIMVLRQMQHESTIFNLRGHCGFLADTLEKNPKDYVGNDELIQDATSIAMNHELEIRRQGGEVTVFTPLTSAIRTGLLPRPGPPIGRLYFTQLTVGWHHFNSVTKKKPGSGITINETNFAHFMILCSH